MHVGKSYGVVEFMCWTRRKTYVLVVLALLPVSLYQFLGWTWVAIPWSVVALLGTAASFIVGFKNVQTYNRTLEAQQIWSSIVSVSRYWGLISRDFAASRDTTDELLQRHLAWLTAMRYQLRGRRVWEDAARQHNDEYRKKAFRVAEHHVPIDTRLRLYLSDDTLAQLAGTHNLPLALIALQSQTIRGMFANAGLPVLHHTEMQKTLKDLIDLQSRAERVKNFPYPRQYAIIDSIFVWAFALLLPFGVVGVFDQLNAIAGGFLRGHMVWVGVPFSVLVSWMYISLDQVGESTENPFEGGANDVPITHLSDTVELELRRMMGERDLPPPPVAENDIVL